MRINIMMRLAVLLLLKWFDDYYYSSLVVVAVAVVLFCKYRISSQVVCLKATISINWGKYN